MLLIENTKKLLELDDEELEIIKDSIDSYHEHLMMANKDNPKESEEYERLTLLLIKIEQMCQNLNIPGFEFS